MKIDTLKEKLLVLKNTYSIVALKTGTEVEDMSIDEIKVLKELCNGIVPLNVKIGGPEARQDMRAMLSLKIDMILAPMIESVYALSNFVDTMNELVVDYNYMPTLGINLETITGLNVLDAMLSSEAFQQIQHVTIGRGDLAKSMGLLPDDMNALLLSNQAISKINKMNKTTSNGGAISTHNINKLINHLDSTTYFNTRHLVFLNNAQLKENAVDVVLNLLSFEKSMYEFLASYFPARSHYYNNRIRILNLRTELQS